MDGACNAHHGKHRTGLTRHGRDNGKEHAVNGKAESREHHGGQHVTHQRAEQCAQRPANVGDDRKTCKEFGIDLVLCRSHGKDLVGHEKAQQPAFDATKFVRHLLRKRD